MLIADLGMLQIKSELQPKDSTLEVNFQYIQLKSHKLWLAFGSSRFNSRVWQMIFH